MRITRKAVAGLAVTAGALFSTSLVLGQTDTSVNQGDWPVYHGGYSSQRYSPLDQINADNVNSLQIAWSSSTEKFGPSTDFTNPSTPLEIDGVLYANIATTR